jgi:type IV secretion system protein TrbL
MCSKWNPICDVESVVGSVGSHVAGSVFEEVAKAFGDAAAKVTEWMWTVIAQTTTVDLSGGWFRSTLGITATLAGVVILAIFVLELIKAVLRREPGALARAVVGIGGGVLGAAASIAVVEALLAATDELADGVVHTAGLGSLAKLGSVIAPTSAIAGTHEPALILVLALGYLIASFFVWAMFVIRKAMIIVAAVFAPVAFSGAAARATSGWVRRWVEFTLAMIFSKLVVVIIFTLAISLVGSPGSGLAAVGSLFSGLAMLVVACFAPWMLLKLVHFIGGEVIAAHHHGMTQTVVQAGATPLAMARSGAAKVAGLVGGGPTGAAAATKPAATGGKAMVNSPVIKNVGGTGPVGGGGPGDGGGGPPSPPTSPGPPKQPGPRTPGSSSRPQPASVSVNG